MKHQEFYKKYKINYLPFENPLFSKTNWRITLLIFSVAILIAPLVAYKNYRHIPFTVSYYMQQMEYFLLIGIPFVVFLYWANLRESIRRSRRYGWVGRFEVIGKQTSLVFCYLILTPGKHHKLKVDRILFEKTRIGDILIIRRDGFGRIEDIKKIKDFTNRLTKAICSVD